MRLPASTFWPPTVCLLQQCLAATATCSHTYVMVKVQDTCGGCRRVKSIVSHTRVSMLPNRHRCLSAYVGVALCAVCTCMKAWLMHRGEILDCGHRVFGKHGLGRPGLLLQGRNHRSFTYDTRLQTIIENIDRSH